MKKEPLELLLLSSCAASHSDKSIFLRLINNQKIDWEKFYDLMIRHRVLPMVFHNLNRWELELPIKEKLKAACLMQTKKALQQTATLIEINSLLTQNSVPCIHFKGPTLSNFLYGDTTLRQYKDIDILVEPKYIDQAYQLLMKNGFQANTPLFKKDYLNLEYKKHTKDYIFTKNACQIELHWSLLNVLNGNLDEQYNQHISTASLNNHSLSIFETTYYLSYLILHGYFSGWARLHWLVDIYDFLQTTKIDWHKLENTIKNTGHIVALYEAIELLNHFFSFEKPILTKPYKTNGAILKNTMRLISLPIINKALSQYNVTLKYRQVFLLQKGIILKLKTSKKILFTSPKDWHFLILPKPLFFLYYPLRPLLWSIRKFFPKASTAKNSVKKS